MWSLFEIERFCIFSAACLEERLLCCDRVRGASQWFSSRWSLGLKSLLCGTGQNSDVAPFSLPPWCLQSADLAWCSYPSCLLCSLLSTDAITNQFLEHLLLPVGRPSAYRLTAKESQFMNLVLLPLREICLAESTALEAQDETLSRENYIFLSLPGSIGPGSYVDA